METIEQVENWNDDNSSGDKSIKSNKIEISKSTTNKEQEEFFKNKKGKVPNFHESSLRLQMRTIGNYRTS